MGCGFSPAQIIGFFSKYSAPMSTKLWGVIWGMNKWNIWWANWLSRGLDLALPLCLVPQHFKPFWWCRIYQDQSCVHQSFGSAGAPVLPLHQVFWAALRGSFQCMVQCLVQNLLHPLCHSTLWGCNANFTCSALQLTPKYTFELFCLMKAIPLIGLVWEMFKHTDRCVCSIHWWQDNERAICSMLAPTWYPGLLCQVENMMRCDGLQHQRGTMISCANSKYDEVCQVENMMRWDDLLENMTRLDGL